MLMYIYHSTTIISFSESRLFGSEREREKKGCKKNKTGNTQKIP